MKALSLLNRYALQSVVLIGLLVILFGTTIGCQGRRGPIGYTGAVGTPGSNGNDGANGQDGINGTDGADAPPTAYTPVALVNPCGDAAGIADEVFIQLANGQLIASYSANANGLNTRFAVLTPGTYVTTDGDNCQFTVNADGTLSNEHH